MEKYGTSRQATDGSVMQHIRFACWIRKATDKHSEYLIPYCPSTAAIVTRKRIIITFIRNYVRCYDLGNITCFGRKILREIYGPSCVSGE